MYILTRLAGGCQEQEAYDLGNNISLRKTCFLCLDANQGTIRQSSLADQGRGGMEVSCHHVFEEEGKKWRGELKSVIGSLRVGCLLKLKVWHSNQNGKLEASDLHGLTGVGHNLLTGQGHHWGLEETLILLPLPRYQAAVKLLYCKRGLGLRNQACH